MPGIPPSIDLHKKNKNFPVEHEGKTAHVHSPVFLFFQKIKIFVFVLFLFLASFLLVKTFFSNKELPSSRQLVSIKSILPDFVGRTEYLDPLKKELHSWINDHKFNQTALIKLFWGKGGYGKSELATAFANHEISNFSLLWTFNCDSQEHIDQGYRHLAEELGIYKSQECNEKTRQKVHFYLENHKFNLPWLLIYDNVEEELKDYPQRGGMILITSQKKIFNPRFWVEIKPFSRKESLLLFEKITHEKTTSAMEMMACTLEDIPLLVNVVGRHISAMPGCTFEEYERLFASHLLKKDGPLWKEGDSKHRYSKNFLASWEFPLKSLEKENPYALKWLYLCGYLHPVQIREEWIDGWLSQIVSEDELLADNVRYSKTNHNEELNQSQPPLKGDDKTVISREEALKNALFIERREILRALQKYGIIQYDEKGKVFSLHRFFQYIIRESRREEIENDLKQVISLLRKYVSAYHLKNMKSWEEGEQWYLNAHQVGKWVEQYHLAFNPPALKMDLALLYEGIAEWCIFNDRNLEALKANYRVLDLRKEALDENSPQVGKAYECLGWNLYKLDQLPEALNACNKAQEIELSTLGKGSVEYALIIATKGLVLTAQGKYEEALKLEQEALQIRVNHYGENHIQVGRSFYHVSVNLSKLGKLTEALVKNDQAMAIYKKTCGEEHPWYNWCIQNQGRIFFEQHKYQEALELYQEALSRHKALNGKDQLALSYCWNGIGWCYLRLGDPKKAAKAFRKGLHRGLKKPEGNKRTLAAAHKGLGLAYIQKNQIERGRKHLDSYFQISSTIYYDTPRMKKIINGYEKLRTTSKDLLPE